MKAIISSTYSDNYLWNLPLVTWLWNKLGVDVICFIPDHSYKSNKGLSEIEIEKRKEKYYFILDACEHLRLKIELIKFVAPEHKEATYAQVLRTMAGSLGLPDNEVLFTSDVDMGLFKLPEYYGGFTITGWDLVPEKQYPMCFVAAMAKDWKDVFTQERTYQQAIDDLLGEDECQDYRGCRWSRDQEVLHDKLQNDNYQKHLVKRSNGENQFATNRYDRDDSFLLERLSLDTIDFHLPRPGFEEKNFDIIMKVLEYHLPNDNSDWLIEYTKEYRKLL